MVGVCWRRDQIKMYRPRFLSLAIVQISKPPLFIVLANYTVAVDCLLCQMKQHVLSLRTTLSCLAIYTS